MVQNILAALLLACCVVLLLRVLIGERRRQRLDAALKRAYEGSRRLARRSVQWPSQRKQAARAAEEAIRRAKRRPNGAGEGGDWDGNVYRPRSFRDKRKSD